jgi:hypothetical protein
MGAVARKMAKSQQVIGCEERKSRGRLTEESGIGVEKFRLPFQSWQLAYERKFRETEIVQ